MEEYSKNPEKTQKALKLVKSKSVKLNHFKPSGRELWTVVGRHGDLLLDDNQPYCSCRDFHYRVLSGKEEICYHLLALKIAKKTNSYDTINFQDEEYPFYLKSLLQDILKII